MTVALNDRTTGPLEMTGGETVISYDWKILASSDLAVWRWRAGAITQLALTTDYTVSGVGNPSGGNVTLVTAAEADDVMVVESSRAAARTSDLSYEKSLPPATLNGEYDSLQIQVQELRRDMDRAIKLSRFETTAPGSDLPEAVAGKALGFNDDGDLDLIDGGGGGGGGGSMTGAEIVEAIDDQLGSTDWQSGGGGGGGATNLGYTASPTDGVVTSDTGSDATLPLATGTNAGLMAPAQYTKLAGIESGASADQTGAEMVAAINAELGSTDWQSGAASGDPVSGRTLKFRRNLTGWQSTSSTSADLTVGDKTLTAGTGKSFEAGDVLKVHQTANSSNYAIALVRSYNSGTGSLALTFMAIVGSGTGITGWTINAAAEYRKPADLAYIESWAIGGGGAGENVTPSYGGAGAGSYTVKAAADLSASETVTVGAGGASGANGGDTTAFGMTAGGGHCVDVSPFDVNGGTASGGLLNISGEKGNGRGAVPPFGLAVSGHPGFGFGVGGGPTTNPGLDGVVIVREHFGSAGSGGGGGATNLGYTASATNGIVTSDTGTDATIPLADGTNAGLMAPAQHTKLGHIAVTQAVDLDAIEARVNALDAAVVLKGTWDASAGTFPGSGTAQAGDSWIVSVAGTVDSTAFAAGDRIIAITDNASTSTYAANWHKADYTDQVSSVAGRTGAVTLGVADIVAAATSRVYGRKASGGGAGEELTLSEVLDFIGSAAQGDILYRGASTWARLGAGTSGQYLKTGGTGANPSWDTPAGGGGSVATDTIWDAKGDLAGGTGANTASRLAVGLDGTVLRADSGAATGMRWGGTHIAPINPAFGVDTSDIYGEVSAAAAAAFTVSADRLYLYPVVFGDCNQLDELAIRVSTLASSTNARVGIWNDSGGKPSTLLVEATSATQFDCSATGKKAATGLAQAIVPGRTYWVGIIFNGAPSVFGAAAGTISTCGINLGVSSVGQSALSHIYTDTYAYGALSGFGSGDISGATYAKPTTQPRPLVGWKVSRV